MVIVAFKVFQTPATPTRTVIYWICLVLSVLSQLYFIARSVKLGQFQEQPYVSHYESSSPVVKNFRRFDGGEEEEKEQHQQHHQERLQNGYPFAFGACLLTKDDTQILPEWLAYHYTVLPLRHLIVAIDPLSLTNPEPIFDEYRSIGMNIETWTGNWYWHDGRKAAKKKKLFDPLNHTRDHAYEIQLQRQVSFYTSCLKHFKNDPNVTWVLLVDTDEYFTYNSILPIERAAADAADREYETKFPRRFSLPRTIGRQNETIAHYIAEHWYTSPNDNTTKEELIYRISDADLNLEHAVLCTVYPRIDFAGRDSPDDDNGNKAYYNDIPNVSLLSKAVPDGFDVRQFHSLRFRYHKNPEPAMLGKSLVNVNVYDGHSPVKNVHRPFVDMCSNDGWPSIIVQDYPFRIHHYSGSLETYTSRPERNLGQWKEKNKFKIEESQQDDSMTAWMHEFVALVVGSNNNNNNNNNNKKAYELTQGAREKAYQEALALQDRIRKSNGTYVPPHIFKWD